MTLMTVMAFFGIAIFRKNNRKSEYRHSMKKDRERMLGTNYLMKNFTVLNGYVDLEVILCKLHDRFLDSSRSREVILPLSSSLVRLHLQSACSSGAPNIGRTWMCWSGSRGGPRR